MEDLKKYRFHTEAFDVMFPNNGLFGINIGRPSKAVADGYYVITKPLSPGEYTIQTKAAVTYCLEPECLASNWASDVTYHLIVK